jgi:hypothetical protein
MSHFLSPPITSHNMANTCEPSIKELKEQYDEEECVAAAALKAIQEKKEHAVKVRQEAEERPRAEEAEVKRKAEEAEAQRIADEAWKAEEAEWECPSLQDGGRQLRCCNRCSAFAEVSRGPQVASDRLLLQESNPSGEK